MPTDQPRNPRKPRGYFYSGPICRACRHTPADGGEEFCLYCRSAFGQADLTSMNRESLYNDMRRAGIPVARRQ
jgi:hypothetical protein